jgi:DNA-binding HxlR family transcriptional regulator
MATEILGDRWTLLIVRDLLSGVSHFNDLERGLPGISRGLLASRLRRLEECGVITKKSEGRGRKSLYRLSAAGEDLRAVISDLTIWGAKWAFGEPREDQLDPILLMWWIRQRVRHDQIPTHRIVIQFDFTHRKLETYWLILDKDDISVCLTHPGFDPDILVSADLPTFFQLWLGRVTYEEATASHAVRVDAMPRYLRAFPDWFAWSLAAPAVREVTQNRTME